MATLYPGNVSSLIPVTSDVTWNQMDMKQNRLHFPILKPAEPGYEFLLLVYTK